MFWMKVLMAGELCLRGYAQYRSMKRGSTTGRMRMSEEVMMQFFMDCWSNSNTPCPWAHRCMATRGEGVETMFWKVIPSSAQD